MRPFTRVLVAVVLAATAFLPLASYRNYATGDMTTFHGGVFAFAIGCCGLVAAALSLLPQTRYALCAVLVASATVVLAVAAALTRIKMTNDASNHGSAPGQTAYAPGAGLAILLAMALLVLVVAAYRDARDAQASRSAPAQLPEATVRS